MEKEPMQTVSLDWFVVDYVTRRSVSHQPDMNCWHETLKEPMQTVSLDWFVVDNITRLNSSHQLYID